MAEMQQSPSVKLVSPVAQAIEIAKSEVNRKKVEEGEKRKKGPQKRKKALLSANKPSKRQRLNPEFQF
jgi:hypothetical protein